MAAPRHIRKPKILICTFCVVVIIYILVKRVGHREDRTFIDVWDWAKQKTVECGGNFIGYGNEFARLRDAVVDPKRPDEFGLSCDKRLPSYYFLYGKEGTHLAEWIKKMYIQKPSDEMTVHKQTTFAVMRYEAHNIYHTMTDWYNVFLVCKLLYIDPKTVDILLIDERPPGLMDETWEVLFGNIFRVRDLKNTYLFKDLIWNALGYESPVNFHMLTKLPFADEFYKFFISAFGVNTEKPLDCINLRVSLIWRRDYMSHPERKEITGGLIHRKFKNEDEILKVTHDIFSGHSVEGYVLEEMDMQSQIDTFTKTDVLIGMHGAGMAHTLFLPQHAVVFETFPNYWGYLKHFKAFCRWRNIMYRSWRNEDEKNEFPDFYTYIPPEILKKYLNELRNHLCKNKNVKTVNM